ncbi:MAG: hypothetical protein ACF8TS_05995 [Maioricimonas sp. JB049]
MKSVLSIVSIAVVAALVSGCGGGSDGRVTASGTVSLDGQPLPDGSVTFFDENGGSAGVGIIENGRFSVSEASSSTGIQPGTYKVAVQSWESEPGAVTDEGEIIVEGTSRIPEKYNSSETSGLTAEVGEGENQFEFDLKSS